MGFILNALKKKLFRGESCGIGQVLFSEEKPWSDDNDKS